MSVYKLTKNKKDRGFIRSSTRARPFIVSEVDYCPRLLTAQVDPSATSGCKVVSQIRNAFWIRWSTKYLSTLQERRERCIPTTNIESGQLVIIKEDNMPVMQ